LSTQGNNILQTTKEIKEERLNIRIEPSLKEEIKKAANQENRSLANFVITILQDYIDKKNNQ
jgi:uncharacterized protein (DUF1778 family)